MLKSIVGSLALVIMIGACGASMQNLRRRAAFDLGCDTVQVQNLGDDAYGVSGCGKRATYIESCEVDAFGSPTSCSWVLNALPQ